MKAIIRSVLEPKGDSDLQCKQHNQTNLKVLLHAIKKTSLQTKPQEVAAMVRPFNTQTSAASISPHHSVSIRVLKLNGLIEKDYHNPSLQ
jgi:hypothetical protein